MIPGKTLFALGLAEFVLFAAAEASDASSQVLTAIGVVTAIGTATIGVYSAFRAAKHRADTEDAGLVQTKLDEAEAKIEDLEHQVIAWKSLAQTKAGTAKDLPAQTQTPDVRPQPPPKDK